MKRFLALIMLVCILCTVSACSASKDNPEPTEIPKHNLYIDINFEENIILAKYDVDLYIDDKSIDTLPHGQYYTNLLELEEGEHEIILYKGSDNSVKASKKFKLTEDTTFYCKLHTNSSDMELNDNAFTAGIIGHELEMPEVTGTVLDVSLSELKEIGFVKVEAKAENDTIWDERNWTVVSQSVEKGTVLDKNDPIVLICQKTESLNQDASQNTEPSQGDEPIAETEKESTEEVAAPEPEEENVEEPVESQADESTIKMPVMAGTNVDKVQEVAKSFGIDQKPFSDEDFDYGTYKRSLNNKDYSCYVDIIYDKASKEILSVEIITASPLSAKEQQKIVETICPYACPKSDVEEVTKWVKGTGGKPDETEIGDFTYEIMDGTSGICFLSGEYEWEDWITEMDSNR